MIQKEGRQCHICMGCGRCKLPAKESLRIVTESPLKTMWLSREATDVLKSEVQDDAGIMAEAFVLADIGTTTVAMELYDGLGNKKAEYVCANPQSVFGADVISRIQAAEDFINSKQMQTLIRQTLEEGLQSFVSLEKSVKRLYIVGNTTMLYLLNGHDTSPLGQAPFYAKYLQGETFEIAGVEAVTLPGLSAFIGADVLAGILACGMQEKGEISLLLDLGTNGELVLGNAEKMLACSTAAGPVFDGLCNKEGERVWGADLIHLVAKLLEEKLVDETGLLAEPYFTQGIDIGGVHITQNHIRQLQTAKAAIATGIECLVQEYGIEDWKQVSEIYLAGGLGYFLKEEDAVRIGLLPAQFSGRVQAVGNTALAGAYLYAKQERQNDVAEILEHTQVWNLARWKDFGEGFIKKLDF